MNTQPLRIKTLALTFVLYLVTTVLLAVALTVYWQTGFEVGQYTPQQLNELAANSQLINVGSALIGSIVAMLCAYFVTARTERAGYKHALWFALGLIAYGCLSIVLHPEHTLVQQVAKIVAPIPLCLIGAWFALYRANDGVSDVQQGA